jgi:hypothetical protein
MKKIQELYDKNVNTPSDINEHLPTLFKYAKECDSIAEFGVRWVCSSYAFALANTKKLICVDIITNEHVNNFLSLCKEENVNVKFYQENTLTFDLEPVDLLFIDTLHSFNQLSQELKIHHKKVNKYIILHDTISFGYTNEDDRNTGENCGLIPAIKNFLNENKNWVEEITYKNNNGLTILKKINL